MKRSQKLFAVSFTGKLERREIMRKNAYVIWGRVESISLN